MDKNTIIGILLIGAFFGGVEMLQRKKGKFGPIGKIVEKVKGLLK